MSDVVVPERILRRIDMSAGPDACWPWNGRRNRRGYGRAGRSIAVSRVVLAAKLGRPLEAGELACHTCDNPPCCNPAHLYAGNKSTNTLDMVARDRQPAHMRQRPTCRRGLHEMSGTNVLDRDRGRICRRCALDAHARHNRRRRQRRLAEVASGTRLPTEQGGACRHGHALTPENVIRYRDGHVSCKTCNRATGARFRQRAALRSRVDLAAAAHGGSAGTTRDRSAEQRGVSPSPALVGDVSPAGHRAPAVSEPGLPMVASG